MADGLWPLRREMAAMPLAGLVLVTDGADNADSAITRAVLSLTAAGVPCGSVRNLQEVFADPQLAARAMIAEIEHATIGPLRTLGVPVKLSDTPGAVRTPPPTLGQHTDTVLQRDLGIEPETISRLRAARVI